MGRPTSPSRLEHYCLFETSMGAFGVAWNERGVTRLQLPEADRGETEKRLRAHAPGASAGEPTAGIEEVIANTRLYLGGRRVDFSSVALDLAHVSPFHHRVYEAARAVGWGQTVSYGDLARNAGSAGAARSVGQALRRNPVAIIIPCHRILASGNKVGGFSAHGGTFTKERLLALEGVHIAEDRESGRPRDRHPGARRATPGRGM